MPQHHHPSLPSPGCIRHLSLQLQDARCFDFACKFSPKLAAFNPGRVKRFNSWLHGERQNGRRKNDRGDEMEHPRGRTVRLEMTYELQKKRNTFKSFHTFRCVLSLSNCRLLLIASTSTGLIPPLTITHRLHSYNTHTRHTHIPQHLQHTLIPSQIEDIAMIDTKARG